MKNKMAKIAFIILSIVFVFSACMTVFAVTFKSVTESQNGIEATLNFNKQEYNANEEVEVTLNVKNNNSYAVKNIQTELIVPSTIKLSKGSLKQEPFSLNAGESKVQEVALEKVVETSNEPTTNSPQTGDNVVVYIAMMTISAVALVVIAVKNKWIHKKKVMSLVLCFTLVGAMTLTSVVNANVAAKEFTVEGTIKYDGEDVVIKGKVTYDYEVYSKVQIDGVDKGMHKEGNTVTITAEDAPEGKHFAGWTVVKGNVTLADANSSTTTFVMGKEDVEIKSNYEVNTYTIDVTLGENGKVTPEGNISVKHGESKKVTITANEGYHIENLESSGKKYQNTLGNKWKSFTIDYNNVGGNYYVKADFAIDTFTISASVNESSMGTITESATVNYGDSKTFKITPNKNYHIEKVEVDGNDKGTDDTYTFTDVKENHTIKATFAIDTFTISASVNESSMGTITESATVNYGDSKTFKITPNKNYHIEKVEVDGNDKGTDDTYTFTDVKENHTIKATFAIDTFTISSSAGANGTITSTATVDYGSSKTFTMTANTGYGVKDVKMDGTSVGPVTSYTFENVNENHTIEVEFETATTVTTTQQFRDAVTHDGIVILANDITLDKNGNVEISKNLIIHGGGHTIYFPQYRGENWSLAPSIYISGSSLTIVENCNFRVVNEGISLGVHNIATLNVYNCNFDKLSVCEEGSLNIYNGNVTDELYLLYSPKVKIFDGMFGESVYASISDFLNFEFYNGVMEIRGGTFYFDPTSYLDTENYKATETKDADNVDIWVVTEK